MTKQTSDFFGKNLAKTRKKLCFTQASLAKASGLQPSAIGHLEGGGRLPSIHTIRKLVTALNITADYLIMKEIK